MSLLIQQDGPVAVFTLNRPEIHNAFDDGLIASLTTAYNDRAGDPRTRVIVLRGNGPSFSAGGDLSWMRRMADFTFDQNVDDARKLAALLQAIDTCPKPTIARVHGAAYAGGLGLMAASDIVVAVDTAQFAVTEVKLGLIPAVISPYLVRAMGARQARRYFLSAERFSASQAQALNLVHEVVASDALDAAIERTIERLLANSPEAMAAAKDLVVAVDRPLDPTVIEDTARRIANARASGHGREGVTAFIEKRKPNWGGDGGGGG